LTVLPVVTVISEASQCPFGTEAGKSTRHGRPEIGHLAVTVEARNELPGPSSPWSKRDPGPAQGTGDRVGSDAEEIGHESCEFTS
jgi:hypothetical protein